MSSLLGKITGEIWFFLAWIFHLLPVETWYSVPAAMSLFILCSGNLFIAMFGIQYLFMEEN